MNIALSPVSSRPPPALGRWGARELALPIAVLLWALVSAGDYLTTAEVCFTLLYLAPITLTVWWRGFAPGLFVATLCATSSLTTWLVTAASTHRLVLAWNIAGELGVYVAVAYLLDRVRRRLDAEVSERESAVVQLRHADRLNTVGKLASGVAHELGTPLNVITGHASIIETEAGAGSTAISSSRIIVEQADRMATIIRNLLVFARRGGSQKAPTDLNRLARETVALLDPLARQSGVRVVIDGQNPHVAAVNGGEMQQVLTNLVMNAVQATSAGGTVRVRIDADDAARVARVHVIDEGTGIPTDVLPHIFDPFFSTKDVGVGTGLGLSITFGIVRDHGGRITVDTRVGEGTTFVVHLPAAPDSAR